MIFKNFVEEKIFLLVMVIFGPMILVLTPPMCTPDENAHFLNAYVLAHGDFFPEQQEGEWGHFVPEEIADFITSNMRYTGNLEEKYSFSEQYFSSFLPSETGNLVFWKMGELSFINPVGYLVSGAGIWTGRLLCGFVCGGYDTPYNLLLFARFFQMLFYSVVCYYAIKNAPFLKRSIMVLLSMPMSIFLGVSVCYDAILIPICILFFSNTFRLLVSDRMVCKTDVFITGVCTFFMLGIKTAYAPFLLLLLFVPKEKFGTGKKYVRCIVLMLLIGGIAYYGYKIGLRVIMGELPVIENEQIAAQKAYFFSHIAKTPLIAVRTLHEFWTFYFQGFYGKLGQIDTNVPLPAMCIFYVFFLFVLIVDICSVTVSIPWKARIVDGLLALVCLAGIFLFMYLEWTPIVLEVGGDVVSGVQGRYFIPSFMYLCLPFLNGRLAGKGNVANKSKLAGSLFSEVLAFQGALVACLILLVRYWV